MAPVRAERTVEDNLVSIESSQQDCDTTTVDRNVRRLVHKLSVEGRYGIVNAENPLNRLNVICCHSPSRQGIKPGVDVGQQAGSFFLFVRRLCCGYPLLDESPDIVC